MTVKPISPILTPIIQKLPSRVPFVGPEALERKRGCQFAARLGANENGFGPAPSVIETIQKNASSVWQYGDPENFDLCHALALFHDIKAENIMIGAGVDALLGLVVRQYISPGDVVINSLGGYPTFNYHVAGFGGQLVNIPYRDNHSDLDALAKAVRENKAKIVYLANPDNPLGTWHEACDIERFIENIPQKTLIILDEAYGETAPKNSLPVSYKIWPNVLRMRTFSKAYGLAGMRCGYAIGPEMAIQSFNKIRDHFGVGKLTQLAALTALNDQAYLNESIDKIIHARQQIIETAHSLELKCLPSATNFVAIDCGRDGQFALNILNHLLDDNIFVRKPMVPILDRLIRVSVGPEKEMALFADGLKKAFIKTNHIG